MAAMAVMADRRNERCAPLGRWIQPSDVRFRVVPAYPELVDALRSVSYRSPSDKIFTGGAATQAIVPQDRGPVDCRRPLREPASKALASHSRPIVTLNLPGAGTGHLGGHQRWSVVTCDATLNGRLPFKVCHSGLMGKPNDQPDPFRMHPRDEAKPHHDVCYVG